MTKTPINVEQIKERQAKRVAKAAPVLVPSLLGRAVQEIVEAGGEPDRASLLAHLTKHHATLIARANNLPREQDIALQAVEAALALLAPQTGSRNKAKARK